MTQAITEVWVDPSWLSWESVWRRREIVPDDGITRLYEIHQHSCDQLAGNPTEFNRVDAIMALRRVVARRVKALIDKYQLRKLATGAKPKYDLELLEYFGIIRPLMLRRLVEIRNIVEHEDSSPPNVDECLMFVDLIWYFLRSTDGLLKVQPDDITFRLPKVTPGSWQAISLEFHKAFSEPEIFAFVRPALISYESREGWIRIEHAKAARYDEGRKEADWIGVKGEPAVMTVRGKVRGSEECMRAIYELYFRMC
jgi:hypothetical protein